MLYMHRIYACVWVAHVATRAFMLQNQERGHEEALPGFWHTGDLILLFALLKQALCQNGPPTPWRISKTKMLPRTLFKNGGAVCM